MNDYKQYSAHCYACQQPVPMLALRCPHCTSALGVAGGPPYDPNSRGFNVGTLFGLAFVALFVYAILYY
jgi:hypothetical protein